MKFDIRPLTKDLKKDYLFFFDNIIFTENPDRSKCYCCDHHFLGDVAACTREISRPFVAELIDENKLTGYLVYDKDRPIGWCNANDRSNYPRLLRDYDFVDDPEDKVRSIVCFLIHPEYRRQGIAQQLLERIIKDHSNKGYDYLEAYPRKTGSSAEGNFKGPLELYRKYDFKVHKAYDGYYAMRRELD